MKILIVDDHALFREGLCHVLEALEGDVSILEAADYDRALLRASENPDLDMVLLDLNMPGKDGFAALTTFAELYPALPVVILSANNQRREIQRSLDAGAMGYIPKDTSSTVMLNALRLVFAGGIYVPQAMVEKYVSDSKGIDGNQPAFTARQLQVLELIIQGYSNKDIAHEIALAEGTVKMHVTSILKNLGVNNRTQAAMAAEKMGLGTEKR